MVEEQIHLNWLSETRISNVAFFRISNLLQPSPMTYPLDIFSPFLCSRTAKHFSQTSTTPSDQPTPITSHDLPYCLSPFDSMSALFVSPCIDGVREPYSQHQEYKTIRNRGQACSTVHVVLRAVLLQNLSHFSKILYRSMLCHGRLC